MVEVAQSPSDLDVRLCALQVLMFFDDEESRQVMEAAAKDQSGFIRLQAWCGLNARAPATRGNIAVDDMKHLRIVVEDLFRRFRELELSRSVGFLCVFGTLELETRLKNLGFLRFVHAAARMLNTLGIDLIAFLLIMARSETQHPTVRKKAILLLGHLADHEVAAAFDELSGDPDVFVAASARMALNLLRFNEPYPYDALLL
jgi:HEAT repeat protein